MLFSTLCIAILAACSGNPKEDPAVVQMVDSLNQVINQRDTALNDILSAMNEIEDGMREISKAEGRVTVAQRGEGTSSKARIKEDMEFIQEQLKKNREKMASLQSQLRANNFKSEELKKAIESLNAQILEKDKEIESLRLELGKRDIHIAKLDVAIDSLHSDMDELREESREKTEVIQDQDKQLNTAWFVFGTKNELKNQNILKGGKVLQGDFNHDYFTEIDIRKDKEIKLYSKSAEILTSHPASSYTLQRDENKQYTLVISDANLFWSTSKYLVIQVK